MCAALIKERFKKTRKENKMKFTIDERIWLHGEGVSDEAGISDSMLYRPSDQKLCCLGIYGTACGVDKERMEGVGTPASLFSWHWDSDELPVEMRWLVESHLGIEGYMNSIEAGALMEINDDGAISDSLRKEKITEIFAKHGIEVEFVNGDVIQEAEGPAESYKQLMELANA